MIGAILLSALLQDAATPAEEGIAAFREGRYEEAAGLLTEAVAREPSYDALVTLGLAHGRLGHLAQAEEALDHALLLDPGRSEAWVERGGLRFLQKRYQEAVRDLEQALSRKEDGYTRDLLATALHLAGRPEEALARWNVMGQPKLRRLEITGLVHTRDRVARREVALTDGEMLELGDLRRSRLRLTELGIFDRVTLRPVPHGDGSADLEVALAERHGFFGSVTEAAVVMGMNAAFKRVGLRYSNLLGEGVNVGVEYRWEEARPRITLGASWPRPLGAPAVLKLGAFRGRQEYAIEGEAFRREARGGELSLRSVLGARTVGQLGLRLRHRSFTPPQPDAPGGDTNGLEAVLEQGLAERHTQRLEARLRLLQTTPALGAEVTFTRALLHVVYRGFLRAPEGVPVESSVVGAQVFWGRAGPETPVDEMFAPGGSPDMELPLRAHPQAREGVLGGTAIGRSLLLGNVEARKRLLDRGGFRAGIVLFYDGARVGDTAEGGTHAYHDVGAGLRVSIPGAPVLRVDFGHGLTDGRNAVFAGLNQVF